MSGVCWFLSLTAIAVGSLDVQEMSAHRLPSMTFGSVRSCVSWFGSSPAAHRPSVVSWLVISAEIASRTRCTSQPMTTGTCNVSVAPALLSVNVTL